MIQTPADILLHEFVGHTIPAIAPSPDFDTGNAMDNENKVRKECNQNISKKQG